MRIILRDNEDIHEIDSKDLDRILDGETKTLIELIKEDIANDTDKTGWRQYESLASQALLTLGKITIAEKNAWDSQVLP